MVPPYFEGAESIFGLSLPDPVLRSGVPVRGGTLERHDPNGGQTPSPSALLGPLAHRNSWLSPVCWEKGMPQGGLWTYAASTYSCVAAPSGARSQGPQPGHDVHRGSARQAAVACPVRCAPCGQGLPGRQHGHARITQTPRAPPNASAQTGQPLLSGTRTK